MTPDAPTPNPSPATHTWELDEDDDRAPCPMGCGNLTDDVAGGPCSACWYDDTLGDQDDV